MVWRGERGMGLRDSGSLLHFRTILAILVEIKSKVRVRVTKLKYVVIQPVYQIIRPLGWSLRVWQASSSSKQAS